MLIDNNVENINTSLVEKLKKYRNIFFILFALIPIMFLMIIGKIMPVIIGLIINCIILFILLYLKPIITSTEKDIHALEEGDIRNIRGEITLIKENENDVLNKTWSIRVLSNANFAETKSVDFDIPNFIVKEISLGNTVKITYTPYTKIIISMKVVSKKIIK